MNRYNDNENNNNNNNNSNNNNNNKVQGYWLKRFQALHERIATQMDDVINNEMDIPKWVTTRKKILY